MGGKRKNTLRLNCGKGKIDQWHQKSIGEIAM
jgi:hypothetical protein